MIKMKFGLYLILLAFASENQENKIESAKSEESADNFIFVKIEEDEYAKVQKKLSKYTGVRYTEKTGKWRAVRWSKKKKKEIYNGNYKDEETAAHASDTLARKLMASREQNHKLNFPDDDNEVNPNTKTSKYIGVSYTESKAGWRAQRWSKYENTVVHNGDYKDEETAAHASDTLARKLMANGEQNHKLNFLNDDTEVYPEKIKTSSKYIGVSYIESKAGWCAQRWSKKKNTVVHNGDYKDEETAAHASDTLAKKFMANGEQNHRLNFPDDHTEVHAECRRSKRKRSNVEDLGYFYNKLSKN